MTRTEDSARIDNVRRLAEIQRGEARRQRQLARDMSVRAGAALQRASDRYERMSTPPSAASDRR